MNIEQILAAVLKKTKDDDNSVQFFMDGSGYVLGPVDCDYEYPRIFLFDNLEELERWVNS